MMFNLLNFLKWPIEVFIYEKRENGYAIFTDKAKKIKDGTTFYYRLKKKRVNIEVQKFEDIKTFGKKNILMLYSPKGDEFYPMGVKDDHIIPRDSNWDYFKAYGDRETTFKHQRDDNWIKFLPIIAIFVTGISIVMILHVSLPYIMASVQGNMGALTSELAKNTNLLQQIVNNNATQILNVPPAY